MPAWPSTGPAVRLAAWFHDGVYDGRPDDEDRSAVWAEEALADTAHAAEVARLVRLTEHHDPADDDLPGQVALRTPTWRSWRAERLALRRVRRRRAPRLRPRLRRRLRGRPGGRARVTWRAATRLFHTAYAREHWEPAARANLARELASRLSAPGQV